MIQAHTYHKKPEEIEAIHFSGLMSIDEAHALAKWCGGQFKYDKQSGQEHKTYYWRIEIPTLEGVMNAYVNDYIIKGVRGEFYPRTATIFKETYERIAGA